MDAKTFLESFGAIAESPGGVDRLRALVYDLAYEGRLVTDGGRAPTRTSWLVATLDESCDRIQDCEHRTPTYSPTGIPALRPRDVSGGRLDLAQAARVSPDEYALQIRRYEPVVGDIVYSRELSLGWAARITVAPVCLSQGMVVITPGKHLDARYLVSFLNGPVRRRALELAVGSAHPHLNLKDIRQFEVPVPPLDEQKRIVAKIDELVQLCDDLEARQDARRELAGRLRSASLHSLTDADTANDRNVAWSRIQANWRALADDPEGIDALRQTVLLLAVRGVLGLADQAEMPEARLADVVALQNGYAFKSDWYSADGIRLVRCDNIGHGSLRWSEARMLAHDRALEFRRFGLSAGDIVLALDRPLISTGLKVARVTEQDLPCLLLQRVARLDPDITQLDPDYLWLWLHSQDFVGSIDPGRSNGVPHISTKAVGALPIRLPSLQRQRSIVDTARRLLDLCDGLLVRATGRRDLSTRLAQAATRSMLNCTG